MYKDFNSHTREGVTHFAEDHFRVFSNFNSHTREGVTVTSFAVSTNIAFQLTHP